MSVKVFNSQIGHISSSFFKHVGVSKSLKSRRGQLDVCIIRLADCAFILAVRPVLEEHWRAGGAFLRPNVWSNQANASTWLGALNLVCCESVPSARCVYGSGAAYTLSN